MNRKRTNDNLSQSNYLVLTFNLYILKQIQLVLIKILFSIVKLFHGEIDQGTRLYVHNKKLAFFFPVQSTNLIHGGSLPCLYKYFVFGISFLTDRL